MKISISLALSLLLLIPLGQAQQDGASSSQKTSNCETHTVTNETTKVSSTITRCRNEAVVNLENKQPEPEQTDSQGDEDPEHHGYPFNTFSDLDAQKSMAESTNAIRIYTFFGVLVGLVGTLLVGRTLYYTKGAMEAAKETLNQAIETTYQASLATEAANRTAIAAENAERAYITVELASEFTKQKPHTDRHEFKSRVRIPVLVKNYGRTIGRSFHCTIQCKSRANENASANVVVQSKHQHAVNPFKNPVTIGWVFELEESVEIVGVNSVETKPMFCLPYKRSRHGNVYSEFDILDIHDRIIEVSWQYFDNFNQGWKGFASYKITLESDNPDEFEDLIREIKWKKGIGSNLAQSDPTLCRLIREVRIDTINLEIEQHDDVKKRRKN